MFERIMVPLDGSSVAEEAIGVAAEVARRFDAELLLLRVFAPPVLTPGNTVDVEALMETERQAFISYLEPLQPEGVRTRVLAIQAGSSAEGILATIDLDKVQLVVMTSHGRTGVKRFLFGSVAEKVVRRASCPVLTIGSNSLLKLSDETPAD